jgi:hypothetical protein
MEDAFSLLAQAPMLSYSAEQGNRMQWIERQAQAV